MQPTSGVVAAWLEALAPGESWRVNALPSGMTISDVRVLDDEGYIEAYPWHMDYSNGSPPKPQRLNNWSLGWVSPITDKSRFGTWDAIAAHAAEHPETALEIRLTDRAHAARTRNSLGMIEPKAAPHTAGSLEDVRDRALRLRSENREVFDEQVVKAEKWYLNKCDAAQRALEASEQAERDAVRRTLRKGMLEEVRCPKGQMLRPYTVRGRFPRQLVADIEKHGTTGTGQWPAALRRRMARACLDAITWNERVNTLSPRREEWQVRWLACRPLAGRLKVSSIPARWRGLYRRLAKGRTKFVHCTWNVVYAKSDRPPRVPNPSRLTWEQIRGLPEHERRSLAWSVIGGLINAQTVAPITAPRERWEDIPDSAGDTALQHMVTETRLDRREPIRARNADQDRPALDPSALDPGHAADLLRIVEDDFRSIVGGDEATDDPYRTAMYFGKTLAALLRHASRPGRKQKAVRSIKRKGVKMYHLGDVRTWWPTKLAKAELLSGVKGA